jgi:hypothetical protein
MATRALGPEIERREWIGEIPLWRVRRLNVDGDRATVSGRCGPYAMSREGDVLET